MSEVDINGFVSEKIKGLERDLERALSKAREYRSKADYMAQTAVEIEITLKHVKEWIGSEHEDAEQPPQIRQLVRAYLAENEVFNASDLVSKIQLSNPEARTNSLQGELTRAKQRGEVEAIDRGRYRSLIYVKPAAAPTQTSPATSRGYSQGGSPPSGYRPASAPTPTSPANDQFGGDDFDDLTDPFAE